MSKIKQLFEPKRNRDDTSVTSLAKFFRNILDQTNVDLDGLYALIDSWMDDPNNNIPKDTKTRSYVRGNLLKALGEKEMTWKTFYTALKLFKPSCIEVTVRLHIPKRTPLGNSKVYEHTMVLDGVTEQTENFTQPKE